eukprot:g3953.t1
MWLIDCEYQAPLHYMSLVGDRLRELNLLEKANPHAQNLMTKAFERVKKLVFENSPVKAVPPNLTKVSTLSPRHKATFAFWQQTGLRPVSLVEVRADMVEIQPLSQYAKTKVPKIKVDALPGEIFSIKVPLPVYKKEMLPITKSDVTIIAMALGTTGYGPRRALAIWARLYMCELGIHDSSTDPTQKNRYLNYKTTVDEHLGWVAGSDMWTAEYSKDAWQWRDTAFAIHPLTANWFKTAGANAKPPSLK